MNSLSHAWIPPMTNMHFTCIQKIANAHCKWESCLNRFFGGEDQLFSEAGFPAEGLTILTVQLFIPLVHQPVTMRSYRSARHWGMPTCPWDVWFCCRWLLFDKKSGTGWCSEFVTGWWTRGINSWTVRIVNPSAGKCLVVSELNLSASFQFAFSDFGWFKKFLGSRPQNEQPIPCLNTTDDQYAFYMYPENCKRTLQMGIMFEPIFWRGRSIILRGRFSIAKVF